MSGSSTRLSRLKRLVGLSHDETLPYQCQKCCADYETQYHVCPACGSFRVESTNE